VHRSVRRPDGPDRPRHWERVTSGIAPRFTFCRRLLALHLQSVNFGDDGDCQLPRSISITALKSLSEWSAANFA
jgi:hypothetical protein